MKRGSSPNPDEERKKRKVGESEDTHRSLLLIEASAKGDIDTVKILLSDSSVNVNARNAMATTALMAASINGHGEIVKALLLNRADVNHN